MNKPVSAETQYADEPRLIRLENRNGMQITLMDWGATWLSCRVPVDGEASREVLLGCPQADQYNQQQVYLGAMIGRYANRIANAHLPYPGRDRKLVASQGENLLHGGLDGFDKRRWQVQELSAQHVRFALHSPDGDQGFPGALDVCVSYHLSDENGVRIEMQAQSDALTTVNLTNHAYFNLDGTATDVRQHLLQLHADFMLPTDAAGIPVGALARVEGTSFDFRQEKRLSRDFLGDSQQQLAKGYDHSFLLMNLRELAGRPAATLSSADQRLHMELSTSLPSMQLYTGNYLAGTPARDGGEYADYAGVALEPQFLPDSPHHPAWPQPSCWLQPGQEYRHWIQYQFR